MKSKTCGFCNQPITLPRGIDNYKSLTAEYKYIWPVPGSTDIITGKYACPKCAIEQERLQLELGLVIEE